MGFFDFIVIGLNSPPLAAQESYNSSSMLDHNHPGARIQNPDRLLLTPCILDSCFLSHGTLFDRGIGLLIVIHLAYTGEAYFCQESLPLVHFGEKGGKPGSHSKELLMENGLKVGNRVGKHSNTQCKPPLPPPRDSSVSGCHASSPCARSQIVSELLSGWIPR